MIFSYEYGNQTRFALVFVVVEAALRWGLAGGVLLPLALIPYFWFVEWWRVHHFVLPARLPRRTESRSRPADAAQRPDRRLARAAARPEVRLGNERAAEAERLRDSLGRRVDVLEAANRSSRALGSSLEMDQAFGAFIREVRGLVPFDRLGIVLLEDGEARVIATAGRGADTVFAPGSARAADGSVLDDILAGQTVYRPDIARPAVPRGAGVARPRPAEPARRAAPRRGSADRGDLVLAGGDGRVLADEIELVSLLGRLVASAVQNIRSYEGERRPSRSCGGSPRCARTSSRSCPTSCAARWRR